MPVKLGCKNILDNVDMHFVLDNVDINFCLDNVDINFCLDNVDNTLYAVSHDALCQQT